MAPPLPSTAPPPVTPFPNLADVVYPTGDGEPLAETYDHVEAILMLLAMLEAYLADRFPDRSPLLLANQFVYYAEGFPRLRFAPDLAVIFGVEPGSRDNYKIWEEKAIPAVIFEMTSPKTRKADQETKKDLYEQLGVLEYWLFDPRAEWIPEYLQGYRLVEDQYQPIEDGQSQVLDLALQPNQGRIACYRLDTGEQLLDYKTLTAQIQQERQRAKASQERADRLAQRLQELGIEDIE